MVLPVLGCPTLDKSFSPRHSRMFSGARFGGGPHDGREFPQERQSSRRRLRFAAIEGLPDHAVGDRSQAAIGQPLPAVGGSASRHLKLPCSPTDWADRGRMMPGVRSLGAIRWRQACETVV